MSLKIERIWLPNTIIGTKLNKVAIPLGLKRFNQLEIQSNQKFVDIEDSDLMSVAKGLDVNDQQAVSHANEGRRFLADPALRHSYGALARTLPLLLVEVEAPASFDLLSLDVAGN